MEIKCKRCGITGTRISEEDLKKNHKCKHCGGEVAEVLYEDVPILKYGFKAIIGVIILIIAVSLIGNSIVVIDAGNKGVLKTWGKVTGQVLDEGLSFKHPISDSVDIIDTKTQKTETKASAASGDMQIVTSTIALNYRIDPGMVVWLRQNIGMNYKFKIIDPAIQEAIKSSTAKFTAEELITKREQAREEMKRALTEKLKELSDGSIVVVDFNIINFDFSSEFNKAIESKVTAEQLALKAERDLERFKFEAQQKIETSRGEAESKIKVATAEAEAIRIQSEALKENKDILQLRWIERWNGELPYLYGGQGSSFMYDLNLGGEGKTSPSP